VVWDWNGTLFDDFDAVLLAMNAACASVGGPEVTADLYRETFTRPIERTYERLLGRPLREGEWARLNDRFHTSYNGCFRSASLAADAHEALEAVHAAGATQSLLSMWEHDELIPVVKHYGVDHWFVRIDGQPQRGGGHKREHLEAHLERLADDLAGDGGAALGAQDLLLVGDSLDDAHAAQALGVPHVLLDSGPHHVSVLEASGAPLASSLLDALRRGGVLDLE
jgi:phosphoglycolate phosphatase-like HAD superfamily hydrolase